MDEMYNEMNLQAEKPKIINNNAENQLHISSTINNVDDTSTKKATHVTYVGENWLEVQHPPVRFPLTIVHLKYFYIMCGLGHSQWKDYVAVRFSQATTVTWENFGQSIEPTGLCDNFFIAGFCRKHFEECHPRSSKKHFFYPKVGTCFFGANSACKLRLSDKLYFPVCHLNHWFVFIVDLKHSCYVFLDSYYNEGDYYQQEVSSALIQGFETAWGLYAGAGSMIDLSHFRILYPPVPKQTTNNDCGIFMLKFMEYWDFAVDMKLKFSQEDIPKIRIQLAHELYFSDKNTEDKSLVNNLYKQGIDPRIIN
ncbi:hypothetical protein U9M48_011460 [Paspalum notatum var. saurae]|uniref:Ubiquitin-like protease family profile domain-containing protein n=1 Tax=Paspalum notatum var. saurae TaxID=547442 RepID=A0AAQ3SWB1_PASNO